MKRRNPPIVAVWMQEHFVPGDSNEALAGDLLEEFSQGRSTLWYWRQVLMAIVLGFSKGLRNLWASVAFAALWSIPLPAFWALVVIRMQESTFITREWHLRWPYSMLCDFAFSNACQIIYIWSGLGAYFLLTSATGESVSLRSLRRGMMIGLLAPIIVFSGWLAIHSVFTFTQDPIDVRHMTSLRLIFDPRLIFFRLPFFLTLLAPFWAVRTHCDNRTEKIAR
jgi:hypothetical protein